MPNLLASELLCSLEVESWQLNFFLLNGYPTILPVMAGIGFSLPSTPNRKKNKTVKIMDFWGFVLIILTCFSVDKVGTVVASFNENLLK